MNRPLYLTALLLLILLAVAPTAGAQDQRAREAGTKAPAPITFSGNGRIVTSTFELESGLAIVTVCGGSASATTGEANRAGGVEARAGGAEARVGGGVAEARAGGAIARSSGGGATSTSERVDNRVSTNCFAQITRFSGDGKTATGFFRLSRGPKRFEIAHQGNGKFSVQLLDKNGLKVGGRLVNRKGPFNGSRPARVPKDGIYLLQVEANGPWTIQLK